MTGHVFTRELDQNTIVNELPLNASDVPLRVLISRAYTDKQLAYARRQYGVRRARVRALIEWAVAHNPYFAGVRLNQAALNALPESGVDPRIVHERVELQDATVHATASASASVYGTGLAALTRTLADPGTEDSIQFVTGIQLAVPDPSTHYANAAQAIAALATDARAATADNAANGLPARSKYVCRLSRAAVSPHPCLVLWTDT